MGSTKPGAWQVRTCRVLRDGGVNQRNQWRKQNPGVIPDLVEADFVKDELAGGDGTGANLYKADLRRANLFGTNLQGVNLRDANMGSAQLGFTLFGDVDLTRANGLDATRHAIMEDIKQWRNRGNTHYFSGDAAFPRH